MPAFDRHFRGNEGFIRPIQNGQKVPAVPSDIPESGAHYLVQDLDGHHLARLSGAGAKAMFEEIVENGGDPQWMH